MRFFGIMLSAIALGAIAQVKTVTETVQVSGQEYLDLEFAFADEIVFKTWDKKEVLVEVKVNIQDGEYNDIFTLSSETSSNTISVEMDEAMWDRIPKSNRNNCWHSELNYTVYAPSDLKISANTISGNYTLTYAGIGMKLKTISGAIDITVPSSKGLEFHAKTISGAIYSDLEIEYPYGKEGLRQVVGQDITGRIGGGGDKSRLETISGDIYLRKG